MIKGADRMEQLEGLADRLDTIAMQAGKRKAKHRTLVLRHLNDYDNKLLGKF